MNNWEKELNMSKEWRKKFDEEFFTNLSYSESGEYVHDGEIKQFIQDLLDKQKEEIKGKIQKIIKYHAENSIPFNPLDIQEDILEELNK